MLIDLSLKVTTNLLKTISLMRKGNDLTPLTKASCISVKEHVRVKVQATYIETAAVPVDIDALLQHMPAVVVGPKTAQAVFQACYERTKTQEFLHAIHTVVPDPKPLAYAITMWHEQHKSQNIKDFLVKVAQKLYTKSMKHVDLVLTF